MAADARIGRLAALFAAALLAAGASEVSAQSAKNVLIVANRQSDVSETVATYYASRRGVPAEQILRLNLPLEEEIAREVYDSGIEAPIAKWLTVNAAQDRILYIVLAKGMPLRIAGTGGPQGTVASVDSELALLYRRLMGERAPVAGSVPNPYFAGANGLKDAGRFSHKTHDIYLVTRLDGYTLADVQGLIDRGLQPSRAGTILLDGRAEVVPSLGNQWLAAAAQNLTAIDGWALRVQHDASAKVLTGAPNVLGYYSWGSNDRTAGTRHLEHQFNPGALAAYFVSTDARTFHEPPAEWAVNNRPFRGSHQSLIADLIREGITGVAGHVAEPYLSATTRPDILFPAYVSGFNLAESFYLALPALSWQTVVVGDPLAAPFRTAGIAEADLAPPLDSVSQLPAYLSTRRVARLGAAGVSDESARAMARADVRIAHADSVGTRHALESAVAAAPHFIEARMALAAVCEAAEAWQDAISQYRAVIALQPEHTAALNNLAYTLATKVQSAREALPFAIRAFKTDESSPATIDTLAWTYHLLGQDLEAEPLIQSAMRLAPNEPEIHVHAAAILLERGRTDAAKTVLDRALKLNPTLADRQDAVILRSRLQ